MAKKQVEVRVDWREERGDSVIGVAENHDEVADVSLVELDVGDIEIRDPDSDDVVVFERKDVPDFASSMTDEDDHMRDQVERLEEATDAPARVLIEGNMEDFESLQHTRVAPQSLRGFVASLEERNGAKIKFCSDLDTLVDYAIRAGRKQFEEKSGSSLRVQSAVKKSEPFEKRVYGCIEGVGPAMAQRLYTTFPTLPEAVGADTKEFMVIEGVGEKLALRIQEELRGSP